MPLLNNQLYTHTGTAYTGLATVVYHLTLLRYSLTTDTFFPSFLAIDSPAVGDLNEQNHDQLLQYLGQIQSGAWGERAADENGDARWQVILTTRRRPRELEAGTVLEISGEEGRMLLRPTQRVRRIRGPNG
jgi:hypothetical protein